MLREMVLFRLNKVIINLEEDIPNYLNRTYINNIYPKFDSYISRRKVKNYFEWACKAFPEYADKWTEKQFGIIKSVDGFEFDSYQEKDIYEFIKFEKGFKYIDSIGRNRGKGKFIFQLDDSYEYKQFCPDYVIEFIDDKNIKKKLLKPIIIEYYGYYLKDNPYKLFQEYIKRADVKEEYYKSNKDIYYIGIFPDDIKNHYESLVKKLSSFFMSNFNIDIDNLDDKELIIKNIIEINDNIAI